MSIWQARTRPEVIEHGRVPAEPKLSPIQKRLILRAFRHSKAYKYTLKEEERAHGEKRRQGTALGKPIDPSQKPDSPSRLKISFQVPPGFLGFLMFCYFYSFELFSFISMN